MQTLLQTSLITEEPKAPKGMKWQVRHKDECNWNVCEAGVAGTDLWFRLRATYRGSNLPARFFRVRDFAGKLACVIELELDKEFYSADSSYPLGRHFHDCLMDACAWGLSPSMVVRTQAQ